MPSINQMVNTSGLHQRGKRNLRALIRAALDDGNSAKADLAIVAGKLDDDAGVTDTNYEALLTSPTNTGGLTA